MRAATLASTGVASSGALPAAVVLRIAIVVYSIINVVLGFVGLRIMRRTTFDKLMARSGSAIGVGWRSDDSEIDMIGELRDIEAQLAREKLADARSQAKRALEDCRRLTEALDVERRRSSELSGRLEQLGSLERNESANGRDHYGGKQDNTAADLEGLKSEWTADLTLS